MNFKILKYFLLLLGYQKVLRTDYQNLPVGNIDQLWLSGIMLKRLFFILPFIKLFKIYINLHYVLYCVSLFFEIWKKEEISPGQDLENSVHDKFQTKRIQKKRRRQIILPLPLSKSRQRAVSVEGHTNTRLYFLKMHKLSSPEGCHEHPKKTDANTVYRPMIQFLTYQVEFLPFLSIAPIDL